MDFEKFMRDEEVMAATDEYFKKKRQQAEDKPQAQHNQIIEENRKIKELIARKQFLERIKTKEGKVQVLQKFGYQELFAKGFPAERLDQDLKHLSKEEKSVIINQIVNALEENLNVFQTDTKRKNR